MNQFLKVCEVWGLNLRGFWGFFDQYCTSKYIILCMYKTSCNKTQMTFPLYIYSSLFFNSFVFCCCFFFADDFNLFLAASLWFRFQNGIFTKNPDKYFSSLLPGYFQLFLRFLCSCWDLIIPAFLICFLKSLFWISFFNLFGACNHRI